MLFPILKVFKEFGWCKEDVDVTGLDSAKDDIEALAKEIAPKLSGKLTAIYSEFPSVVTGSSRN